MGSPGSALGYVRDPRVGDVVDRRYMLRREVARGGMGAVFEAEHVHTGRPVAVKLLHSGFQLREDIRERLLREARALTCARHPGVVDVLDAGMCDEAGAYLVLEMLEGRTLDGVLVARGRLAIADAVQIGRQICEALAFAHARGVVHRDIKPSNVLICRNEIGDEVVKLIDFGIAHVSEVKTAASSTRITRAGEVLGTFDYMSPEQLLGQDCIDPRTDIYSAGATLYECLTGEVPYTGSYQQIVVKLLGKKTPRRVCIHREDVPEALALVVERAIAEEPDARFADALAFADALLDASGLDRGRTALLGAFLGKDGVPTDPERLRASRAPADGREAAGAITVKIDPFPGEMLEQEQAAEGVPAGQSTPAQAAAVGLRRRFARAPYVTPARILRSDGGVVDGRTQDVSERGLLIVTDGVCAEGEPIRVRFALPITGLITTVSAETRWVRTARGRTATGVELTELDSGEQQAIAAYVELMRPVAD